MMIPTNITRSVEAGTKWESHPDPLEMKLNYIKEDRALKKRMNSDKGQEDKT